MPHFDELPQQQDGNAHDNVASQKVLTKAGFVPVGPAEPGGRPGTWYQRDVAAD